jgi:hypothetical protein
MFWMALGFTQPLIEMNPYAFTAYYRDSFTLLGSNPEYVLESWESDSSLGQSLSLKLALDYNDL